MPKYEYEYIVEYTETHRVFVEADSEEEARKLAEEKYYNNHEDCELTSERIDFELNWSDDDSDVSDSDDSDEED